MKVRTTALILVLCLSAACAETTQDVSTDPPTQPQNFELGSTNLTLLLFGLAVLVTALP
jgi:hypothetical protein